MKNLSVIDCDRCGLSFFDYEGYEEIEGEGIVCSYCIEEEELEKEEQERMNAK